MKKHACLIIILLVALVGGGASAQQYAVWDMTGSFDANREMTADAASAAGSLIRVNPASAAFSKGLGDVVICTQTGPADFLRVDIDDLGPNGGGEYVNAYTMVFDLRIDAPDWLPLYNTNYNNNPDNPAEVWISPDGAVGAGSYYSAAGTIVPNKWARLVLRRSNFSGGWQTELFVDGAFVVATNRDDGGDGQSSLYTNTQQDMGQFTILSDGDEWIYGGCVLGGFQFYSRSMSDEEIAALGEYPQWVRAFDPQPAVGQTNVLTNATLSWTAAADPNDRNIPNAAVTSHFVYMNAGSPTDPNMTLVATLGAATTQFQPAGLSRDKTYLWRVDEGIGGSGPGSPNNIVGQLWHFATVPSSPVINPATPADVEVFPGEPASSVVEAVNPFTGDATGLKYEWYRYVDGTNDVALGVDSPVLAVPSVEVAQEGRYYCVVTIISNSASSSSRLARLTVKRAVGYWPLDGNANDASDPADGSVNGAVNGSPAWVAGIKSQAASLDPSDADVDSIVLGAADDLNFGADGDFSVSVWIKSTGVPTWASVISNKDWDSGDNVGWGLFDYSGPDMDWNFGNGGADEDLYFPDLYDGQWHNVCATNDRGGLASVYVDGELAIAQSIAAVTGSIDAGNAVSIGVDGRGNYPFKGAVDEVQIFNYVLQPIEVARIYTGLVAGVNVCLEPVPFDLNDDCRVNLGDFAILAGAWLDCNLVPACIQ